VASEADVARAPGDRVPDLDPPEGEGEPQQAGADGRRHGQNPEDGPGRPHEGEGRARVYDDVEETPGRPGDPVEGQEPQAPEGALDDGPEDGQEEHVPEEVEGGLGVVEEGVREEPLEPLGRGEAVGDAERLARAELYEVDEDVEGNEEEGHHGRTDGSLAWSIQRGPEKIRWGSVNTSGVRPVGAYMAQKTAPKAPRIINQHEYISIDFGNGRRLTASFSGAKAAGAIPPHVWKAWLAMIDSPTAPGPNAFLVKIEAFAASIGTLWPEWNVPPREFKVGETVKFDFGPKRGGTRSGKIEKKSRTSYVVRFDSGLISISGDMLAEQNG